MEKLNESSTCMGGTGLRRLLNGGVWLAWMMDHIDSGFVMGFSHVSTASGLRLIFGYPSGCPTLAAMLILMQQRLLNFFVAVRKEGDPLDWTFTLITKDDGA